MNTVVALINTSLNVTLIINITIGNFAVEFF